MAHTPPCRAISIASTFTGLTTHISFLISSTSAVSTRPIKEVNHASQKACEKFSSKLILRMRHKPLSVSYLPKGISQSQPFNVFSASMYAIRQV